MNLFRKHKKFEQQLHEQLGDMEVKPSTSLWDKIDSEITKDPFESGVQSSLENFEQMPYPETWAKIEAELPEPKVGGRFAKYYVGASLAVLFGVGLYVGNRWQSVSGPEQQLVVQSQQTDEQTVPAESLPQQTVSADKDVVVAEPPTTKANNSGVKATKKESTEPAVLTAETAKEDGFVPARSVSTQKVKTTAAEPAASKPDKAAEQTVVLAAAVPGKNNEFVSDKPKAPEQTSTENSKEDADQPRVEQSAGNNNGGDAEKQVLNPTSAAGVVVRDSAVTTSPQTVVPLAQAREVSSFKADSAVYAQKIEELNKHPQGEDFTAFSISVLAGGHLSFTTYGAPKDPGTLNFERNIELRKELERPMIDWAGGFLVDYRLNKHWMLSSGVMMVNFNQKFEYSIEKAQDPNVKNEAGAPTFNPTDSFVAGNQSSDRIRYSWTEIPLFVNYTIMSKNKWNFDMQAGVSYAFINTIDAAMIGYDNKGVLLLRDKTSFPNIQNTVFVTAMPQLSYQFAPSVAVGVAPTFKYSVLSIVGNDRWIQQHPYWVGLNVCLRKRF